MTDKTHEPNQYRCEYCGSENLKLHTADCQLAHVPWLYRDGRVMPSENRMALAKLREAVNDVELYKQK